MPLANATLTSDYGEVRNLIIQDGRYSIYWHLAHGSIKVAVGDTVNPHDYLPD